MITLQEALKIVEERGLTGIILHERYASLEVKGDKVVKKTLLADFPEWKILNNFDTLIFSFDSFPDIRYVGPTQEALKFVGQSVSGRYYSDPTKKVSKMTFESFDLTEVCGEIITGWKYDNGRYVEKIQRVPWFGNACFIYTYLCDILSGHKMFLWKINREQRNEFDFVEGTFRR